MTPVPETNRAWSDSRLIPISSLPLAAALQEAGHAVVGVKLDPRRRERRQVIFYFESTAQPALDRLRRIMDELEAGAERAGVRR